MSNVENRWKEIWEKKKADITDRSTEFDVFCALKKADGFDVAVNDEKAYYKAFYDEFERFWQKTVELAGSINSVYEVGCGCGVNLYLISNRSSITLGGMDYSDSLLKAAKDLLKDAEFCCGEAKDLDAEAKYDLVMEESVFEYFPDRDYACEVAEKMIQKSGKITYFGGIYNEELKEEMMAYRRSVIPDHDNRYRGLDKSFYPKEWFESLAEKYNRKICFTEVCNPEYLNGKYQYNCYIYNSKEG